MILPCQQHLDMGERSNFIDLPMALAARTKIRDWGVANIAQTLTQIVDPAAEIGASLKLGAPPEPHRAAHDRAPAWPMVSDPGPPSSSRRAYTSACAAARCASARTSTTPPPTSSARSPPCAATLRETKEKHEPRDPDPLLRRLRPERHPDQPSAAAVLQHISAYGWIGIPIAVIRNGRGPMLFLGAGNHGDEYEGQIVLARLIRELDPGAIQGRLIVMPAQNLPAALAGARCSPIDAGNLNRSFPGDPDGPPTAAIAHFIESVLLTMRDAMVDLHSGGKSLDYLPSALVRRPPGHDPNAAAKRAALEAFRAPIGHIVSDAREDRTLTAAADRVGIIGVDRP